jgi:hypothetical protein
LQEARRQATTAIDFYNRSGDKRSFSDFVIHMHLAWQNLLHAEFERRKTNIYFREANGHYKRDKTGQKVSWDLTTCLKKEFADRDPTRLNIEFFVGLRNSIEHRFQDAILIATAAQSHASVINFERELITRFGTEYSLGDELRFPVFVQSLTPEGMDEQRKLRKQLPQVTRSYITSFEASIEDTLREDLRYEYRVQLIPLKGPKTDADLAFTFVNTNALTREQVQELAAGAKTGTVIVAEKQKSVGLLEELLPKAATAAIAERIPFRFNLHHFTKLRHAHRIGPAVGVKRESGDGVFCIFSKPHQNHLYTRAYVDRCVGELATRENWVALFGVEPKEKIAVAPAPAT